jgi:hypothetical protein
MLGDVPWAPEYFSAPALQAVLDKYRRERMRSVPFFDGLLSGETDALVASFSGVPMVRHPVRGRIEGEAAFRDYIADTTGWLKARNAGVEPVDLVLTEPCGIEEVILHVDHDDGRVGIPWALAADYDADGRILEMRQYFSPWPFTGLRTRRAPLLAADPKLRIPDVVGKYERALVAGDVSAVLAAFEPDGYVRAPAGGSSVHRGAGELRALFERLFSDGGGLVLEACAVTDDGRACALEYNLLGRGRTALGPEPALAVLVRGDSGKLAAARVYDDVEPLAGPRA